MNTVGNVMGKPVAEAKQTKMAKIARAAVTASGLAYVAASMKFNPTGSIGSGFASAKNWFNTSFPSVTKYLADGWNSVKGYASNAFNSVKSSDIAKTVSDYVAKAKSSNIGKTVSQYATKGLDFVKNSSVGRWAAKNPVAACAIAAATLAAGFIACKSE